MLEDIQAAIPLGFFLSFMIGPVFFVLLETSVVKGFRAAISFDLGVVLADIIFIFLAYFSSYQLLENLSNQPGLYIFGGTLLSLYGVIVFSKKTKGELLDTNPHAPLKSNYLQLFVKGFLLNFINVGVLVFWLGIIIVVGPNLDANPSRFLLFFGTLIISYFLTDVVKILLAKRLKAYLTPLIILNIKKALGVLLLICGITLITKGFLPKDKLNPTQIIEDIR
ncbi:MAG: LysE family translocator [Flavobacteriaceae bacterium]|nr:LysE family transporter [Flavobacteriaceae bacterium]MDA9846843.1 LysE family transporter [Flavobacteriaceae bacterium]MDC0635422.1 LysE family transporter [Flavobacteriaceae bacterium]